VESAREKKQQKQQKKMATSISKTRKNIQIAVNRAKAALNRRGIAAREAEKNRE